MPTGAVKKRNPIRRIMRWKPLRIFFRALGDFRRNHLDARSAQFAYYSMLATAPLLILTIAVVSHLPLDGVLDGLKKETGQALPNNAYKVIETQISDIQAHSTMSLVVLALIVLCFSGSNLFIALVRGLNTAFGVKESRRRLHIHSLALLATLLAFVSMLTTLSLLVIGPTLTQWLADTTHLSALLKPIGWGARWSVVVTTILFSLSFVYWLAPNARLTWSPLSSGNLFATAGLIATSLGFRFYTATIARYNEIYSALGGVIVLMIWFYLSGAVVLMGGQINGVIYRAKIGRRK